MPSGIRRTHEEFCQELQKITNKIIVLGHYQRNIDPILCQCAVCNYRWNPTPKILLKGIGCPKCAGNIKLTHSEFLDKLHKENPKSENFDVIGHYDGMYKKIECKCKVCGESWFPRPNDLIQASSGCPYCSGNIVYSHKRFLTNLEKKNPHTSDITFLSSYTGALDRIKCKCNICGHEWSPIASSLIQGTGCPECAKIETAKRGREVFKNLPPHSTLLSHEVFMDKFMAKNPHAQHISIIGKYTGAQNPIECKCKRCNTLWKATGGSLLQGSGCPKCKHTSTSFMEQFLYFSFIKVFGENKVRNRDKTLIKQELDIAIPSKLFAVEIGSWRWHKSVCEKDLQKKAICQLKGIKLILIYDAYNYSTETGFDDNDIWTYDFQLGEEIGFSTLKNIVEKCLGLLNEKVSFTDDDWNNIIKKAYNASYRVNHEEFLAKVRSRNEHYNDIIIQSEYHYAKDRISCKCRKCGKEWETAASELIKGSGCPACQIKAVGDKKSKKELILEWRRKNPKGNKLQCEKATGISRMTVYKWWNS